MRSSDADTSRSVTVLLMVAAFSNRRRDLVSLASVAEEVEEGVWSW